MIECIRGFDEWDKSTKWQLLRLPNRTANPTLFESAIDHRIFIVRENRRTSMIYCNECSKTLHRCSMHAHMEKIHRAIRKYICALCYMRYDSLRSLRQHFNLSHRPKSTTTNRFVIDSNATIETPIHILKADTDFSQFVYETYP